jgi:hypothetical protein
VNVRNSSSPSNGQNLYTFARAKIAFHFPTTLG